jgi:hypothetical protein
VYGKVTDFQSIPFAIKLFKLAHEMKLDSLANESANFIRGQEFKANEIFDIYDLFVQKDSKVGQSLCSKSKVCVLKLQ